MEGKFHIEQPDQSKEARFLGISTREEINRKLSQINSDIVINPNTKGYESTLKFPHQESNRVEISPEEYDLFREEFNTDVRLFSDRIQRLKMRALDQYLAGSTAAISKEEGELSYDQEKLTFIGKLRETAAKLKFKKEKITEDEFKNLVSEANRRLPNGQAIRPIKEPLKIDAEQIYSLTFSMQYGKPPSKERGKMLEGLIEDINEIESELSVIEQQGELFSDKNKNPISEEKFEDLWDKYRELLKRVANIEELTSWHSPTYGTSGKGERGVEQRSEKFLTDYQRWKMWEALELERRLHSDSFGKRVRSGFDLRMESILTNSGMTALEAIMQGIDMRSSRGKKSRKKAKIFKTKDSGKTWNDFFFTHDEPFIPNVGVERLAVGENSDEVFIAGRQGLFYTKDAGEHWQERNNGFIGSEVVDIIKASDGTLYAGTYSLGMFKSTDQGQSWT